MTCQELQSHLENASPMDGNVFGEPFVAEHMAGCAQCSRRFEGARDLHTSLRLLRDSVPSPAVSLDAAVLANYRRQVADINAIAGATSNRERMPTGTRRWNWSLSAVAALGCIVFVWVIFGWSRKQPVTIKTQAEMPPAALASPRPQLVHPSKPRSRATRANAAARTAQASPLPTTPIPASLPNSAAEEFRSLMYCDELSCGGGMDVVRVQLPSSELGLVPGAAQAGRVVSAEVLVGADGIARGIRIVH